MDNKEIMKWAAIAGGAYLVYWYITSYGPDGSKKDTGVSYWDAWFGGQPQVPAGQQTQPTGYPNQPPAGGQPGKQPVLTQPSNPPPAQPASASLRAQIAAASSGNPAITGGYAVPDVWSYYWQQITGRSISANQLASAFPPGANGQGAPLNLDQFLAGLQGVGVSGVSGVGAIVTTQSAPTTPNMNFGGSFARKPGLRGMGGRGLVINGGQTIQ